MYPEVYFVGVDLFEAEEAERLAKVFGVKNCEFYRMDVFEMCFKEEFDYVVLFMALWNICESFRELMKLFGK